uniref:C2 domain-containing protein n=1 Tax=Plectus sambesii TaxID=2011161 RepID=A0A914X3U4_9BILA
MPGTLRVKVVEARNLPVMDRSAETTDAFVEIHFGGESYKTDICPKSLSPRWNSEWFVFEAEDHELQDECLQLRIMDYDIYSANDSIGRVYFDVNPLVEAAHRKITDIKDDRPAATWTHSADMIGWLPIYDTLNGHRGELRIEVQLELFADTNKLRESSCGVQVFVAGRVPPGQRLIEVHGLVHDLLTAGDPEYQWLDKIRTPRATNEARQALLRRLSSELTRKIGRKVLEMGANAVLGYRQCVDVEGEASDMLVVRAIGTAVTLVDETQTTVNRAPSPSSPNKAAHH